MSNTLWETLRTRDKLQLLDQTEKLGGKLSSASTNFLQSTSAVFSDVFNSTYETLNTMVTTKANIANQFMDVTTNFVSRTGNLVSSWLDIELSPSSQSDDQKTKRSFIAENLLNQSIVLVNTTNSQLAKLINETSILLESSMDSNGFVNSLINSTARILESSYLSLGKLLNSTNRMIESVVGANQENFEDTAASAYNATTTLLKATTETVTSFLKATTLLISEATNSTMLDDGSDEPTIRAMHATKHALSKIFNTTTTLMQGVINKHKHVIHHVVDTTGNFLEASMDVKANIFTKTMNFSKNVKNATVHLVANKLQSAANKLVSALDHMEQHFEQSDTTQSKPQAALDPAEQQIDQTPSQSQLNSQVNDAQAPVVIPPEIIITPVEAPTDPIIHIETQTELEVDEFKYDFMQPTVDSPPESVSSAV